MERNRYSDQLKYITPSKACFKQTTCVTLFTSVNQSLYIFDKITASRGFFSLFWGPGYVKNELFLLIGLEYNES